MTADLGTKAVSRPRGPVRWLTGWRLWTVPARARVLIILTEAIAVLGLVAALSRFEFTGWAAGRWLLIAAVSILHAEAAAKIERMRRYLSASMHITMTSVWVMTAVLALPAGYAATLVALVFGFSSWQRSRQHSLLAYRDFYNGAVAVLATLAASGMHSLLIGHLPTLPAGGSTAIAAVMAAAVYFGLSTVLVLSTINFAVGPMPLSELLPDREEFALEAGTLVLGLFTAQAVIQTPWLLPLVILLLVLLQRSSLVSQLEVAAATDTKTGLLNASAWQELAQRELVRSQHTDSPCALLLLDLDHFKRVNDTLGHLAGDSALRAIGEALKRELRGYDAVARFGGEEFVVLLNDLNLEAAVLVAERTLARIRSLEITASDGTAQMRLTASIGLAAQPQHGQHLTDLLEAADVALYAAKHAGRDRVGLPPENHPAAHPA
jgi:diguanylate cyclase (GGDEF)-like protein